MTNRLKVGVQLQPQHTTVDELRAAWQSAERMQVDSIWVWDHFFPLYGEGEPYLWPPRGEPSGRHFEAWSLLAAMAVETDHARIGVLISNVNFRNPDLLADMARTVDHLSRGRVVLGLGAGNIERDFAEYGFDFLPAPDRLVVLEEGIERIKERLSKLRPPTLGALPLMVGGGGAKVTLRLVAEYADMWNSFGPPEEYARQNAILDHWCRKVGRDPDDIERTVLLDVPEEIDDLAAFAAAGVQHVVLGWAAPFDVGPVQHLLASAAEVSGSAVAPGNS